MIPIFFDMYINLDGVFEHLEHLRDSVVLRVMNRLHMVLVQLRMTARILFTH